MGMTIELIDKQELLDWIQNCWDWATVGGITSTTVLKQTMTDISQLPTAQAIPKADYENRLKADLVAMLTEIQLEVRELWDNDPSYIEGVYDAEKVIQQKINSLKEAKDGENNY